MDPITTAIVSALIVGAAKGATTIGENAITDAYNGLKNLLRRKFGADSKLVQAVDNLEDEPDFEPNKAILDGRVTQSKANLDPEILEAARVLLNAIKQHSEETKPPGVNLQDIEAAAIRINDVVAAGTGVNVEKAKIDGDITISGIIAGVDTDPNP